MAMLMFMAKAVGLGVLFSLVAASTMALLLQWDWLLLLLSYWPELSKLELQELHPLLQQVPPYAFRFCAVSVVNVVIAGAVASTAVCWTVILRYATTSMYYFKGVNDVDGADLSELPKRPGECPPPYPNAWYQLMYSDELKAGEAKSVDFLDQRLVAFRSSDGKGTVSVLDAYCTHMGANLGKGGTVEGACIRCPFHGWKFDGTTGQCVDIAYSKNVNIPKSAAVRKWVSSEDNGSIYVFYHVNGEEPTWHVPHSAAMSGRASWHGRSEHHVAVHIQDIPENGADIAHLFYLHPKLVIEWVGWIFHISHRWKTCWIPNSEEKHRAYCKLQHEVVLFKRWHVPLSTVVVNVHMIGPALVHIHFDSLLGRIYAMQAITPMAEQLQRCRHDIWGSWTVPRFIAKLALRSIIVQFERDVRMWNHKTHQHKPILVQGDGKIMQFRRWMTQFYCKESYELFRGNPQNDKPNPNLLTDW